MVGLWHDLDVSQCKFMLKPIAEQEGLRGSMGTTIRRFTSCDLSWYKVDFVDRKKYVWEWKSGG